MRLLSIFFLFFVQLRNCFNAESGLTARDLPEIDMLKGANTTAAHNIGEKHLCAYYFSNELNECYEQFSFVNGHQNF